MLSLAARHLVGRAAEVNKAFGAVTGPNRYSWWYCAKPCRPMKWGMGARNRLHIFGNRVRGARISLQRARERAAQAAREADAAECRLWSAQMEGFGGPAQPSPTIAQCLNAGYSWLEVMCHRCETRASLPLDTIRRPRDTPIWKLEAALKCRSCRTLHLCAAGPHDQADKGTKHCPLRLGSPG